MLCRSIGSDYHFVARPAPSPAPPPAIAQSNKRLTEPIEFNLSTERRGASKKFALEEQQKMQKVGVRRTRSSIITYSVARVPPVAQHVRQAAGHSCVSLN